MGSMEWFSIGSVAEETFFEQGSENSKQSSCQNGMARSWVVDGGDGLQMWKVAANIFNMQSRTAERGGTADGGTGEGLPTPHRKKKGLVTKYYTRLGNSKVST
jgi:hypothetical protein